jgi:hypothetical protein
LCSGTDVDELEPIVEQIFDAMHDLYTKWKARSFLLMDVPPMQRSPGGTISLAVINISHPLLTHSCAGILMDTNAERYDTWNEQLLKHAATFADSATQASVFVVSAHRMISDILDHPENFGLSNPSADGGSEESFDDDEAPVIWDDNIHLSSAAHEVFAVRLLKVFDRSSRG